MIEENEVICTNLIKFLMKVQIKSLGFFFFF